MMDNIPEPDSLSYSVDALKLVQKMAGLHGTIENKDDALEVLTGVQREVRIAIRLIEDELD